MRFFYINTLYGTGERSVKYKLFQWGVGGNKHFLQSQAHTLGVGTLALPVLNPLPLEHTWLASEHCLIKARTRQECEVNYPHVGDLRKKNTRNSVDIVTFKSLQFYTCHAEGWTRWIQILHYLYYLLLHHYDLLRSKEQSSTVCIYYFLQHVDMFLNVYLFISRSLASGLWGKLELWCWKQQIHY